MKVAIASSNGEYIDEPFGCAEKLYIYELDERIASCGIREVKAGHTHEAMICLIRDCEILIASKIGCNAADTLILSGIYPLVTSGNIRETLSKLHPRIQSFRLGGKNQT